MFIKIKWGFFYVVLPSNMYSAGTYIAGALFGVGQSPPGNLGLQQGTWKFPGLSACVSFPVIF